VLGSTIIFKMISEHGFYDPILKWYQSLR